MSSNPSGDTDAGGPLAAGAVPVGPGDRLAVVLAAESDRAGPAQLTTWVARKRGAPRWQLTSAEALGAVHAAAPQGWTVGRVLSRLGAELRALVVEGGRS